MRAVLLVVLLVACGREASKPSGPEDAVFPHSEEFVADHGAAWRATGTCNVCHDPLGEEASAGPACVSCHPAYPHLDGFAAGSVHGTLWEADPTQCVGCHGEEGERAPTGAEPGACTDCHASYPHPTTWASPAFHGASVRGHGGTEACESCHGASLDLCAECHASYPHPDDWIAPSSHGAAWLAGGGEDACGTCHGEPDPGGVPACVQCHAPYPHPDDWTPTGHIPVVQAQGDTTCEGCHPPSSLRGPRIPNSCASACHGEGL